MNLTTSIFGILCAALPSIGQAFVISFNQNNFGVTPTFSNTVTFSYTIDIAAPLAPGVYDNPSLNSINYNVSGSLVTGTPSTFPSFALSRSMVGNEFYDQGSSLRFQIAPSADLSDGVQIADLVELADFSLPSLADPDPLLSTTIGSNNPVFVFNGREIQSVTGFSRFHPSLLGLNSDGTGSLRNSNNIVNLNGFDEIPFGAEYVTNLTFGPATTLSSDTAVVPLPAALWLFVPAISLLVRLNAVRHLSPLDSRT
jgi:hypothetical protein